MKIKKVLKNLIAGAAMLAIAGTASAATTYDINIYGASAQFTFWNTVASDWIKTQSGCSDATPTLATFDGNNKITYATCSGGDTYNVRVSSKASFDGILALKGDDSMATSGSTAEKCSSGDTGYPGSTDAPYYRKMVKEDSCTGTSCSALKCVRVLVGASDVAGASFKQSSSGNQHGTSSSSYLTRSFSGISTTGLGYAKPFVVPFAFYVNTDNTTLNTAMNNNITRMMAVLLFSGQIDNWSQLGSSFPSLHTTVCLRHAGSGTHSTLDFAVLRGNGWGALPASAQNTSFNASPLPDYDSTSPDLYFNDTTGDEQACIHNNAGAIGYYDADKADFSTKIDKTYSNVKQLAYQGEYASADSIKNGRYDFWTNEWAYKSTALSGAQLTAVNSLLTYVTGHIPTAEVNFWVDQSGMTFEKTTDQAYPQR